MSGVMSEQIAGGPPPGFYQDESGRERWWDGAQWSSHYRPKPEVAPSRGPMTHGALEVERKVSYVRQQTAHSFTKHLLFGWLLLWIPSIYFAVSPNHYYKM